MDRDYSRANPSLDSVQPTRRKDGKHGVPTNKDITGKKKNPKSLCVSTRYTLPSYCVGFFYSKKAYGALLVLDIGRYLREKHKGTKIRSYSVVFRKAFSLPSIPFTYPEVCLQWSSGQIPFNVKTVQETPPFALER